MGDMTETRTSNKSPLWMRITLLGSLAANLLVAGLIVGVFAFGGSQKHNDRGSRETGSVFTRALEPEDRRALRRDFISGLKGQRDHRQRPEAGLQNVVDVLRSTPFDAEAFTNAMSEQSDRRKKRDEIGRTALAARIAAMSDAERAAYADRVEQGIQDLTKRLRR